MQKGIELHEWDGEYCSRVLEIDTANLGGNAEIAVARKVFKCARKLHLVATKVCSCRVQVFLYSRKDEKRKEELIRIINGKQMKKTARNNAGKRT